MVGRVVENRKAQADEREEMGGMRAKEDMQASGVDDVELKAVDLESDGHVGRGKVLQEQKKRQASWRLRRKKSTKTLDTPTPIPTAAEDVL